MNENSQNNQSSESIQDNGSYRAKLHILGSGSALPTKTNFPTSQILEIREKQYMIDCGEGTQIRLKQMRMKTNRLGHIFISHLHGDHCFGLTGLISSFGLINRTADLHIHAHPDLERLLTPLLNYFCGDSPFHIFFHPINPAKVELIHEDRSIEVYTIPLKHRVPCCGFLFKEKIGFRHINRAMVDYYQIPVSKIGKLKLGEDYLTDDGEVISNELLTTPPTTPVSYAYCSDTAYNEQIISMIKGVDLLYHEATFADNEILRARQTMHSTARQAAMIAQKAGAKKLIIGHFSARYNNKNLLLNQAKEVFEDTLLAEDMSSYGV
ncbi:MAG: ribonuclease Z [Paludibacteraceae bacterium]